MDNKIKNLFKQLVNKESLKETDINDVLNINKRNLYSFVLDLLNTCVKCDFEALEYYDNFLNHINQVVDDFIIDNEDAVNKYYNVVALNLISFFTHAFYCDKRQDGIFDALCMNPNTYKLIKILNDNGSLTQSELANKLGINTTALSNRLISVKDQNVVRKYKLPTNQKQTYYALTSDCKKFYNRKFSERKKRSYFENELNAKLSNYVPSREPEMMYNIFIPSDLETINFVASAIKNNGDNSFFKDRNASLITYIQNIRKNTTWQTRLFAYGK